MVALGKAMDVGATQEDVDFLVILDSMDLTRDHISVYVVGEIIMFLRSVG